MIWVATKSIVASVPNYAAMVAKPNFWDWTIRNAPDRPMRSFLDLSVLDKTIAVAANSSFPIPALAFRANCYIGPKPILKAKDGAFHYVGGH